MKVLALDVGGTAIKSALLLNGQILNSRECPSEGKLGGSYIIKNIRNTIDSYDDYDVIGISTTGQVDSNTGIILYANENVPNYTGTPLKDMLVSSYRKPVYVENDVNAAAIGEGVYGAGKGEKDFLCLTYGTGVGGAIVINGEIYKGSLGIAGELGHMITHVHGLPCSCGMHGCYEQYASTTALLRNAMNYNDSLSTGLAVFNEMNNGNLRVKELVDSWIDEILIGLVNLIHIFNPSRVILGGGILKQPYVITTIQIRIQKLLMEQFRKVSIVAAELENNAGVFGMAAIAAKSMKE